MISNAIKLARNEHVVYFLLTSYLDARSRDRDGSALPEYVKRLPIAGRTDVDERLRALSQACRGAAADRANVSPVLSEAAEVLLAASEHIVRLQSPEQTPTWNTVERSRGGHVRRRRLLSPMTDREAAEWSDRNGIPLERADKSFR